METIKTYGKNRYIYNISDDAIRVWRESKRAKDGKVYIYWWSYNTEEQKQKTLEYIENDLKNKEEAKIKRKEEQKQEQKQKKQETIDNINIWDLLHRSRWYNMTINEFYQVIDKNKEKVEIRPIKKCFVDWEMGYNWEEQAIKDAFIWEWERYKIGAYWIKIDSDKTLYKWDWNKSYYFNYVD